MLGKLIKQEIKVTSRYFIPMYISFPVVTIILKLSFLFSDSDSIFQSGVSGSVLSFVQGLMIFIYVVLLIGISLLTYFTIIRRFYSNMFGDEGYLMFTLPVTPGQLLISKLINSFFWLIILIPINLGSFLLLFINTEAYESFSYYGSFFLEQFHILEISGFHVGILMLEVIVSFFLETLSSLLLIYLSITLGHHFFSEHRLIGSIGFFLVISTLESALTSFAGNFTEDMFLDFLTTSNAADLLSAFHVALPISMVLCAVLSTVYYLVTRYLLTNRLNLG